MAPQDREATFPRDITPADRARPHPLYCVWEITLRCDLGCKHCGSRAGHARPSELDTREALDVVDQLHHLGVREVTLIGGEAYLREDWDQIARAITDRGMLCGITTGARNLTDERLERAVKAGIKTISVSIDGLERTHDALRGASGSFSAAVDACRRISKTPIRLATNTQINRLSLPELCALADLVAAIGTRSWQIQLTVPMGRGADRPKLLLEPYELLALYPLLLSIKEDQLAGSGVTIFPGNNIGYFGPHESKLRYRGDRGVHWSGCAAGKYSMGLEADGTIKACPSLPTARYAGGNVRDRAIADAMQNAPEITFLSERTKDDLWGFCRDCYYADVCKAGCTWTSQVFFGKPGNNPYCIHRALEHDQRGLRERLVKIEDAPGRPFDQGLFDLVLEPARANDLISGFPLAVVKALDWRSAGLWSEAELADILKIEHRSPGRLPILV